MEINNLKHGLLALDSSKGFKLQSLHNIYYFS